MSQVEKGLDPSWFDFMSSAPASMALWVDLENAWYLLSSYNCKFLSVSHLFYLSFCFVLFS